MNKTDNQKSIKKIKKVEEQSDNKTNSGTIYFPDGITESKYGTNSASFTNTNFGSKSEIKKTSMDNHGLRSNKEPYSEFESFDP